MRKDLQNDVIGAKYLQVEKSVYFMDYEIFLLEVPVKEHGKPEIIGAKNTEIAGCRDTSVGKGPSQIPTLYTDMM